MSAHRPATHRWERGYVLLLGGARSGKSTAAVELAEASARPVVFVATATADDDDMATRIARHKGERPGAWTTIEAPLALDEAVASAPDESMLIIDCITLWASNLLLDGRNEADITLLAARLGELLAQRSGPSIVVSNEVGLGVVPEYELGRHYRDALGRANAALAGRAYRSVLLIAGRAVALHDLDGVLT